MQKLFSAVVGIWVGICGLVLAGPAAAVSLWHGDVYTSSLLGNAHVGITLPAEPTSISDLLGYSDLDKLGVGLGSGYVKVGSPITLNHTFAPGVPVGSVEKASLVVSVVDLDFGSEEFTISVENELLDTGKGRFFWRDLFGGSVGGLIANTGDSLQVTIAALTGDLHVKFSALAVQFTSAVATPAPTPAIPEPTAALVFAAGLALVARRR